MTQLPFFVHLYHRRKPLHPIPRARYRGMVKRVEARAREHLQACQGPALAGPPERGPSVQTWFPSMGPSSDQDR